MGNKKFASGKEAILELFHRGIIVSCQANPGNPLYGPIFMSAMAQAAEKGGARALRVNGPDDIKAVKENVKIPVIGSNRIYPPLTGEVYITPTLRMAEEIVKAGADIVTLDATPGKRPGGLSPKELIGKIKSELGVMVMADISTLEEAENAEACGADIVATTLAGFTPYSRKKKGPDVDLVRDIAGKINVPVIAEGRIWTAQDVREVFSSGAYAAVIGTAITNPMEITKSFVEAVKQGNGNHEKQER